MSEGAPLVVRDDPTLEEIDRLEERIYEFNADATGFRDGRLLAIFVHDAHGELLAGLSGHTWGGCCEIKLLWIRAEERRRGLGSRLLEAAEREARRRGCSQVLLSTHSFQAPGFYRKHGYAELATLDDYPRGHGQTFFRKALAR